MKRSTQIGLRQPRTRTTATAAALSSRVVGPLGPTAEIFIVNTDDRPQGPVREVTPRAKAVRCVTEPDPLGGVVETNTVPSTISNRPTSFGGAKSSVKWNGRQSRPPSRSNGQGRIAPGQAFKVSCTERPAFTTFPRSDRGTVAPTAIAYMECVSGSEWSIHGWQMEPWTYLSEPSKALSSMAKFLSNLDSSPLRLLAGICS